MSTPRDPPLVTRPASSPPRPGVGEGLILTIGFAVVLFGTIIVIFFAVAGLLHWKGEDPFATNPGDNPTSLAGYHPTLVEVLAWSFPLGYLAGLVYAVIALRLRAGPDWAREVGLRRLPPAHLGLGLLALPAFVILSDALALFLFRLFDMMELADQGKQLADLFRGFHPAFVVVAVGVGPGVVEELWCRGFLGRGFVGRYGWVGGVGLASLFFGLLHLYPPPYVVVTAVMGACLHFAYLCSRSLWVPIAMHSANNGFAGLAAVGAVPTGGMERALEAYTIVIYLLALGSLVACGWAMWSDRAVADGPRGVMVPPGGVTDRPARMLPALLALGCAAALAATLAVA
jgi:membrane protease YdiL (CAAX protease family)